MNKRNYQLKILFLSIILFLTSKLQSTEYHIWAPGGGGFVPTPVSATLDDVISWTGGGPPKNPAFTICDGTLGSILPPGAASWHHILTTGFSYTIRVTGFYFYAGIFNSYGVINVTARLSAKIRLQACNSLNETMTVYLRSSTSPYAVRDVASGIMDSSGNVSLTYTTVASATSYYIVGVHRNSIETWSASPQIFSAGNMTYDFTTGINKAYGNNMILVNGKACFYTGDVNQDGFVNTTDVTLIGKDASIYVTGYVVSDLNHDALTDLSDIAYADNNAYNFIRAIHP